MADVHLYSFRVCPFAQRVRLALRLKGAAFREIEIDYAKPKPDWFLALNPAGQVPVLRIGGEVLAESSVIVELVDEMFAGPALLPRDPFRRARHRLLIDRLNQGFAPAMYRLLMNQDPLRHFDLRDAALAEWRWLDGWLAAHAGPGPWVEPEFGAAELSAAPFFQRWCLNAHYRAVPIPQGPGFARVAAWAQSCLADALVAETGMSADHFIKYYEDYALGVGNARIPPGRTRSSFDDAIPPDARPLPSAPDWVHGLSDLRAPA